MIEQNNVLKGVISIAGMPIPTGADPYTGSYEVTPKVTQQILLTSDKRMTDDVTVKSIPYAETSNPKGLTVIIGGL